MPCLRNVLSRTLPGMEKVTRFEPTDEGEQARRAHFTPLVVAYFVRAIGSLSMTPRGPQLAMRKVWASEPPAPQTPPPARHRWD